jgi:hypothetical protein
VCEDKKKMGYSIVSDNDFSVLTNEFIFGALVTFVIIDMIIGPFATNNSVFYKLDGGFIVKFGIYPYLWQVKATCR